MAVTDLSEIDGRAIPDLGSVMTDIAGLIKGIKDLSDRVTSLERRLGDDRKVAERVSQYILQTSARGKG